MTADSFAQRGADTQPTCPVAGSWQMQMRLLWGTRSSGIPRSRSACLEQGTSWVRHSRQNLAELCILVRSALATTQASLSSSSVCHAWAWHALQRYCPKAALKWPPEITSRQLQHRKQETWICPSSKLNVLVPANGSLHLMQTGWQSAQSNPVWLSTYSALISCLQESHRKQSR